MTLRLEEVGARYGRRLAVSRITTPTFTGGEVVSVIGPNAAGKSTLFKRMAGLLDGPGRVVVEASRPGRNPVAYLPQDTPSSAVLTVYETVLLARKQDAAWSVRPDDLSVVDTVLESLGIGDLALRTLGELSGGQRQLASIAQTLAREPEILLMDEPTSALDLQRQIQVLGFLRRLARRDGLLVFVALHDLNQAVRFSDRTLVIADGTLRGSGPGAEVVTDDLLRELYGVEARVERCSRGERHVIVDGVVGEPATPPG